MATTTTANYIAELSSRHPFSIITITTDNGGRLTGALLRDYRIDGVTGLYGPALYVGGPHADYIAVIPTYRIDGVELVELAPLFPLIANN